METWIKSAVWATLRFNTFLHFPSSLRYTPLNHLENVIACTSSHTHTLTHKYTRNKQKKKIGFFRPKLNGTKVGNYIYRKNGENSTNGTPFSLYLFIYVAHLEKKLYQKYYIIYTNPCCVLSISILFYTCNEREQEDRCCNIKFHGSLMDRKNWEERK